jgi:conjugative relaxase-like TrwC/TraI family protein
LPQLWGWAVISVQPLAGGGGSARYYLRGEAGCEHEASGAVRQLGYYTEGPEPAGRWLGNGAQALGLTRTFGEGDPDLLHGFLDGRGPGGERLMAPVWRVGPDGSRIDIRRCGFDVTLSAPKSVSVLMGLADPQIAVQVRLAHQAAVTDALHLLEQLTARAARGHQGDGLRAVRILTSGLIAAAFEHHTSRAADPQLHTHLVIANMACARDGRWSALDSRTLHRQATTASYLYQARLGAELTGRLGASWSPVDRGVAEIGGIDLPLRRAFSARRVQIEAELARLGQGGYKAARIACLTTRPAKDRTEPVTLAERWWATARSLDFHPRDLRRLLGRQHAYRGVDLPALTQAMLGPEGVTRESSTFDQGALVRQLCQHLPPGVDLSAKQILRLTGRLLQHPDVLPILSDRGRAYSTVEMVSTEQPTLDLVTARTHDLLARVPIPIPVVVPRGVPTLVPTAHDPLRPDQQRLVEVLLASGCGVEVVAGEAGSGKTRALATAPATWVAAGSVVRGTAVAALTARGLQDATGAPSVSLTRLLQHPERHLPTDGVLLVDEAGMVGTRTLTRLLELTQQASCKVVLVGDPGQLPELEAGGLFAALTRRPEAITLTGHHRQAQAWEGQALSDLRNGRPDQALDTYDSHDRLHTADSRAQLMCQLASDYVQHRKAADDPWQVLVLAQQRLDLRILNTLIRARLRTDGVLGDHQLTIDTPTGPIEYRTGEQVIRTRNDHQRGLLNGHTGTVTRAHRDALTVHFRDGRHITLSRNWLANGTLEHGYALTVHKAQGRTVETALLWGDQSLYREASYVGMSRGRAANHLYLSPGYQPDENESCLPRRRAPINGDKDRGRGLSSSHAQELALHQLSRDTGRGCSR